MKFTLLLSRFFPGHAIGIYAILIIIVNWAWNPLFFSFFWKIGGTPAVIRYLLEQGLLDGDCLTGIVLAFVC